MYSRISCEVVTDPKNSAERSLDTMVYGQTMKLKVSRGFLQYLQRNSDTVSSKSPKGVFQINY
jgi:hypothetical protein